MHLQPNELVALGHGIWIRSDEVAAVEPIRDARGPGRRTRVWVRGVSEPFIASRSDEVILRDLTESQDLLDRERRLEEAIEAVTEAVERIPPMLLRVLQQETGEDLRSVAASARQSLAHPVSDGAKARGRAKPGDAQARLPVVDEALGP